MGDTNKVKKIPETLFLESIPADHYKNIGNF